MYQKKKGNLKRAKMASSPLYRGKALKPQINMPDLYNIMTILQYHYNPRQSYSVPGTGTSKD